jgi:hypothetical protein
MDRPDLRLRDAIRPPEVEADRRYFALPVLRVLEYGVDFLLRELPAQVLPPGQKIGYCGPDFRPFFPMRIFAPALMKLHNLPINGL